jgi:hypothetical protein
MSHREVLLMGPHVEKGRGIFGGEAGGFLLEPGAEGIVIEQPHGLWYGRDALVNFNSQL